MRDGSPPWPATTASSEEIADRLDVSLPTVYRSINSLVELGFLEERPSTDEEGNQRKVFETLVRRIGYDIEDSQYTVSLELNRVAADQLEGMWGELNETEKKVCDHEITMRSNGERTPTLR